MLKKFNLHYRFCVLKKKRTNFQNYNLKFSTWVTYCICIYKHNAYFRVLK